MRIVIANEPRAYREVLEQTIAILRPHLEVVIVEPDDLDCAISHLRPHLVLSSRFTSTKTAGPLTWIVLYPEGERLMMLDIAGRQTMMPNVEFDHLIAIVDETERLLAQTG